MSIESNEKKTTAANVIADLDNLAQSESRPTNLNAPGQRGRVLMRARDLRKAFGGQVVLDGVCFDLHEGEVVLLRGDNGAGKTVLLNIVTGNMEPDSGEIQLKANGSEEHFRFPSCWWQQLNPFDHFTPERVAREAVGRTWQDVRLFRCQSLRDNIAVATPSHPGENPLLALFARRRAMRHEREVNRNAYDALEKLGLKGREQSSADKISLGQSKRVAIARAVAAGARILFLDEPLAGLDHQGISNVLSLLQALVQEHRVTLVIVEHLFNQPHLQGLVTTNWLLKHGILKSTPNVNVAAASVASTDAKRPAPGWFQWIAEPGCEIVDQQLTRGARLTRFRSSNITGASSVPVLKVAELRVRYGNRVIFGTDTEHSSGFSLSLNRGEIAVLQAPNGWGKTTLLAAISGLVACSGEIMLNGRSIAALKTWERTRLGLRTVMANSCLFPNLKLKETLALADTHKRNPEVEAMSDRTASSLSGGERQRAALVCGYHEEACACLSVFDEPFSMLDEDRAIECVRFLRPNTGATLILIPTASN